MAYDDMSDKDKIKSIITNIMEWLAFDSSDEYYSKLWETGKLVPTSCPVAFLDYDGWCVRYDAVNEIHPFDPLHNLDDAWLIVESHKFVEIKCEYSEGYKSDTERWRTYECSVFPFVGTLVRVFSNSMPEAICKAALLAIGQDREI